MIFVLQECICIHLSHVFYVYIITFVENQLLVDIFFLEIRRFSTSGGPPFLREHQVVCDNRRWGWRWPWCSGAVRLGGSVQRWQPPNYGTPWCSSSELPSWFTSLGQVGLLHWVKYWLYCGHIMIYLCTTSCHIIKPTKLN